MDKINEVFEIYGDSIRAGFNLKEKPYIEMISAQDIFNFSSNGASLFDFLQMAFRMDTHKDRIAIIGCGVNDLISGRDPELMAERLFEIVNRLKFLNRKVIVESILPVKKNYFLMLHPFSEEEINREIKKMNSILKENASKYEYLFLEYNFGEIGLSTRDGVHPDSSGNMQLYQQLISFLNNNIEKINN